MQTLWQDLRYGTRMLVQKPGFSLIAIFTLALGIGVNTALFTVYNAFVLRPLPLSEPQSLVTVRGVGADESGLMVFSYPDYLDYCHRNTSLEGLVLLNKVTVALGEAQEGRDNLALSSSDRFVGAQIVSANYFAVLRAAMTLGRGFLPEEEQTPLTHPVVVLSYNFWQRHFAADSDIIGKPIRLQGQTFTIVGVTGREFIGTTPDTPAFWIPLMMRDAVIPAGRWNYRRWLTERNAESFNMLGRLKPGMTVEQAGADLSLIARQLAEQFPDEERATAIRLKNSPGFIALNADDYRKLAPLPLAVGLVLLIACANVANLLLARSAMRQKEIGVRLALGASRWRVIRQLLTESVLLASIGGLAGLLLALWTLSGLYPIVLSRLPIPAFMRDSFVINFELDYRIFGFAVLASLVAGMIAGLAPALQASRPNLTAALKEEGSTLGQKISQSRLRSALAVAQVAVSLMLLIAAGLLVRSLQKAQTVDTGMQTRNLFSVATSMKTETDAQTLAQLRQQLAIRLRALPGVQSVAQALRQPSSGVPASTWVTLSGRTATNSRPLRANYNFVSPEYLSTLNISLINGRNFTVQEAQSGAPVVVISESTARRFWPELKDPAQAIGQHLGIGAGILSDDKNILKTRTLTDADIASFPTYEVIGITRDTRSGWVWQKDETYLFVPLQPDNRRGDYLLVQTRDNPQEVMAVVRNLADTLDSRLLVGLQRTEEHLDLQLAPFRAIATLAGVLGLLALLLAAVGLYGVMSFIVTQRTREIGIRLALGAKSIDVIELFLKQSLKPIGLGVVIGLLGGIAISRLLVAVLVDVSPADPLTFVSVASLLTLVALLACYIPARRATKVDPLVALRYE